MRRGVSVASDVVILGVSFGGGGVGNGGQIDET